MDGESMLLCDIGNSFAKLYDGVDVHRLAVEELKAWKEERVCYINVNQRAKKMLQSFEWVDLEPYIKLQSPYKGLGADRKALCSFVEDGVVVDAGSAVTVDVMRGKKHKGGFIYPGVAALKAAFGFISPALDKEPVWPKQRLPLSTQEAIGYGILMPLVCAIGSLGERVILTGGDAKLLADYLPQATLEPLLIFKAMEKIIQRENIC